MRAHQAQRAARERQQARFRQQLPDELHARGPHGQAHRHFPGARRAPRQLQVGHVGAGDQQHQPGDANQQKQRLFALVAEAAAPVLAFLENHFLGLELRQHIRHRMAQQLDILQQLPTVRDVDSPLGPLERHPRLQPAEQADPIILAVGEAIPIRCDFLLHAGRDVDLGRLSQHFAGEPLLRHPHNRHGVAVDFDALIENPHIAAEA